jgi:lactoylglutathione lyase
MYLYETHLAVADTSVSQSFYTQVVGLKFAYHDPTRDIVFLWAGDRRRSMVGLWGPTSTYGADFRRSHLAFAVTLEELLVTGERLRRMGIICEDFNGQRTDEPSVIGWMPSAQLYFRDPDGHCVEFIALLDETPDPTFLGSLSEWRKYANRSSRPPAAPVSYGAADRPRDQPSNRVED